MDIKAYNRMIKKMRKYVSQKKTFDQFRHDTRGGYRIAWGTMYQAWKVAEMQVFGSVKSVDRILTYK